MSRSIWDIGLPARLASSGRRAAPVDQPRDQPRVTSFAHALLGKCLLSWGSNRPALTGLLASLLSRPNSSGLVGVGGIWDSRPHRPQRQTPVTRCSRNRRAVGRRRQPCRRWIIAATDRHEGRRHDERRTDGAGTADSLLGAHGTDALSPRPRTCRCGSVPNKVARRPEPRMGERQAFNNW